MYAVDHWLGEKIHRKTTHIEATQIDLYKVFLDNVGHFSNLVTYKKESTEAAKLFKDNSVDMVFIDGAHEYEGIFADIKAWKDKPIKMLAGNDFQYFPIKQAITDTIGMSSIQSHSTIWYKELC